MIRVEKKLSLNDIKLLDQEKLDMVIFKRIGSKNYDKNEKYQFF